MKSTRHFSLLHLMPAIARAHASTRATSFMCVKNSTCHLCLWHLLSGTWQQRKWKREQTHQIVDHFSFTFVDLSLAWMLHFYQWLQIKRKFLVRSEYYDEFGIYQPSRVSTILEPREVNLSNPEAYPEPCQIPTINFFAKKFNG